MNAFQTKLLYYRHLGAVVFCSLTALLIGCSGGGGGGSAGITPIITTTPTPVVQTNPQNTTIPPSGTNWSYDAMLTSAANQGAIPSTGVVQVGYLGTATYRGSPYSAAEISGTIEPKDLTVYFTWNGKFEESAYTDPLNPPLPCSAPRSEVQLASPLDFTVPGSSSGLATNYQCQTSNGTTAWSLSVSDSGPSAVTVPAGAFLTEKISGTWVLGTIEKDYAAYMFGDVIVERDTTEKRSGIFFASYTIKLRSGPVNVAEPGPSMLGASFW